MDKTASLHKALSKGLYSNETISTQYIIASHMIEISGEACTRLISKEFELELALASERLLHMEQDLAYDIAELALLSDVDEINDKQKHILESKIQIQNLSSDLTQAFHNLMYYKGDHNND